MIEGGCCLCFLAEASQAIGVVHTARPRAANLISQWTRARWAIRVFDTGVLSVWARGVSAVPPARDR